MKQECPVADRRIIWIGGRALKTGSIIGFYKALFEILLSSLVDSI
jgi:hypothetical protein